MSWLPRLTVRGFIGCHDDGEVEGRTLFIEWRSFEIEISFGRHNGRFR